MTAQVTLIGIGDDGCSGLTSRTINVVEQVGVLAGAERHLAFFPQFRGELLTMRGGLNNYLDAITEAAEAEPICVLASGDPLFFGLGRRLTERLGRERVRILPSLSSVQLAFARLRIAWDDAQFITLHGRPMQGLVARLQQGDTFALLTDKKNNPVTIAQHLAAYHEEHWRLHICESLGGTDERVRSFSVAQLCALDSTDINPLNVMILQRDGGKPWGDHPLHCTDDAYLKRMPAKGLITKQPVRALALANLNLSPTSCVWDVGSASGSVAIEAAKQAWRGQVFSVECNEECFDQIQTNAQTHRVDNLKLIKGRAPQALIELPAPDAVFIGGSRGAMADIFNTSWEALRPGGRLVIAAVTLDSVTEVFQLTQAHNLKPQIMLVNIAQGAPLAHYTRYAPESPIHLFILEKKDLPL